MFVLFLHLLWIILLLFLLYVFEPAARVRIVDKNSPDFQTGIHFRAAAAGFHLFFYSALTDWTYGITVGCFCSRYPAAGTVDHILCDFRII
jgi:hypothetical protein